MTYIQMKMLIEFIKLCVRSYRTVDNYTDADVMRRNELETRLLLSCGYERKF